MKEKELGNNNEIQKENENLKEEIRLLRMLLEAKEDMINEQKSKNQQLINEKDNLIHQKEKLIHQQENLIDQKDKFINHQQALIQDLKETLKSFALQKYK
jgi:hypothetical protein